MSLYGRCSLEWSFQERRRVLFVPSEQKEEKDLKRSASGDTRKEEGKEALKKVSLDPLYDSTDKYRRILKPIKEEDLLS